MHSNASLRTLELQHLRMLADVGGHGWFEYVLDKAARLAKADPIYAGLVAEIGEHIGPDACVKANKALEWFAKSGNGAA